MAGFAGAADGFECGIGLGVFSPIFFHGFEFSFQLDGLSADFGVVLVGHRLFDATIGGISGFHFQIQRASQLLLGADFVERKVL